MKSYLIHKLKTEDKPIITNHPEDKFETLLFLPLSEDRKGEGGLRTKGFFKHNYKLNPEDNLWYVCDTAGNLVKPTPEETRKIIVDYINSIQSSETERDKTKTVNELPLITIITVVFNGEKYLEQTIQSVINQTYPNVEYIIIDGGSTDGTLDIIKKYEHFIDYWVSERDKGIYDAMNKGVRVSLGNWVGILGSDDYYEKDALRSLFFEILEHIDSWVIYGHCNMIYNNKFLYLRTGNPKVEDIKYELPFMHQSCIYKANLHKKIGMYDIGLEVQGDYEFFLRAYFRRFKFSLVNLVIANYRIGGFSSNEDLSFKNYIAIGKRYRFGFKFFAFAVYVLIKIKIKKFFKLKENSTIIRIYRLIKWKKIKNF